MKALDALKLKFAKSKELDSVHLGLKPLSAEPKKPPTKFQARYFKATQGNVWNPVRNYPVNHPCFCGSLVKAKKCCMPFLAKTVSEKFAGEIRQEWSLILCGKKTLPRAPRNQQ